jgi:hypothetical protein
MFSAFTMLACRYLAKESYKQIFGEQAGFALVQSSLGWQADCEFAVGRAVGMALIKLAATLNVTDRTLRRWQVGGGVPRDTELVLAQLLKAHAKYLRGLANFLEDARLPNKKGNGILAISFAPQKQRPLVGDEESEGWREIRADQTARRMAGKKAAAEHRPS